MDTKRILVVDDEAPIRHLAEEAIVRSGWEVDTVPDSTTALQLVRERLYDAAVLDFALPDMDGVRLHSEIRRIDPVLAERTLFISGLDQSNEQLRYFADVGGFLPKPFGVRELIARLRDLVES
jgi:two-component system cell cycle sensor histidine kinase/response regulator CckA